jgi:hypothetical protein
MSGEGGIVQLGEQDAQDEYLTGNQPIRFFRVIYRRHTNFAVESLESNNQEPLEFLELLRTGIKNMEVAEDNTTCKFSMMLIAEGAEYWWCDRCQTAHPEL